MDWIDQEEKDLIERTREVQSAFEARRDETQAHLSRRQHFLPPPSGANPSVHPQQRLWAMKIQRGREAAKQILCSVRGRRRDELKDGRKEG